MITRVRVSNFKSLGSNVELVLGPLTVFVGPNGSGKSSVLDVFAFLADCMTQGLDAAVQARGGMAALRRWSPRKQSYLEISLHLNFQSGRDPMEVHWEPRSASYRLRLSADDQGNPIVDVEHAWITGRDWDSERDDNLLTEEFLLKGGVVQESTVTMMPSKDMRLILLPLVGGHPHFRPLYEALRACEVYSIQTEILRAPQPAGAPEVLEGNGENWCSVLQGLGTRATGQLTAVLEKVTGRINGVRVQRAANHLVAQFRYPYGGKGHWTDTSAESDGTLRVAALATALLQDPPPTVIGVEEPELTVHPGVLPLLYDLLAEAALRSQVLVTTHSPEFLELVDPDAVRVTAMVDGATTLAPLDSGQKEVLRQRLLTLGEMARGEGLQQESRGENGVRT